MAKKKTATRKAKTDPYASQASLDALLKFGPSEQGLQQLQQQAQDTYGTTVAQARGAGQSAVAAVDKAAPAVKSIYDGAGLDQARTAQTLIGTDLAGLGGVANSIKAGAASEQAQQLGGLRTAQAAALTDLLTRRTAAVGGVQFAEQNARGQLSGDLAKILTQKNDIDSQKGAYTALTEQQLRGAAEKLATTTQIADARLDQSDRTSQRSAAQSERNSERSAGIDPDTGKPIPGGKLDPAAKPAGKPKSTLQPTGAQARAASQIAQIAALAKSTLSTHPHLTRAQLVQALQPIPAGKDDAGKSVPAVPGFKPDVLMTAALDQVMTQGLSPATQRALQKQGYNIGALNVTSVQGRRAASHGQAPRAAPAKTGFNASLAAILKARQRG